MHPIIFQTKFFTLHTFWIFFALAIIAGAYTFIKIAIKRGLKLQFISQKSLLILFWAIIGARIIFILTNLNIYFANFNLTSFAHIFALWDKGFNLWGGILAGLFYFYKECKKEEQDFWKWLDAIVPAFIVAFAVGHVGAFFDGMNYGNETNLPWGVNFENPAIKYAVPIHPTQIYAFLYSTVIASILIYFEGNKAVREVEPKGLIGVGGVLLYTFFKFLEEFVRGDDTILIFSIRLPHILTFVAFISTSIFFYRRYNEPIKKLVFKRK